MAKAKETITKQHKERVIKQRLINVEIQRYEQELALKVSESIGDPEEVRRGLQSNIAKQTKAIDILNEELITVEALPE